MTTTISVTPGYIGQKTSADRTSLLTYSITTDGTMSDITEKINGVTIAIRTNPTSGQEFTVSLTQEQWDAIKYGNAHTLTIEMGGDTWTYTFDKRLDANDGILSAVKGVQDLQTHLNAIKAQLGAAIRAKGGTVNDTDPFSAFVNVIANMTNKRWASGTTINNTSMISFATNTTGRSSINTYYIEVTGLNFQPSLILVWTAYGNYVTAYKKQMNLNNQNNANAIDMTGTSLVYVIYEVQPYGLQVTNGSFRVPVATGNTSWNWIAME